MKREQAKAKFDLVASTIRRIYGKGAKSGQPRLASSKLRAASDASKGTEYRQHAALLAAIGVPKRLEFCCSPHAQVTKKSCIAKCHQLSSQGGIYWCMHAATEVVAVSQSASSC